MGDVVARIRRNARAELGTLFSRTVGANQHAVAARLTDRLDHQFVEMFQDITELVRLIAEVGLDVRQDGIFTQVVADDPRYVGIDGLIIGYTGANGIGEGNISRA